MSPWLEKGRKKVIATKEKFVSIYVSHAELTSLLCYNITPFSCRPNVSSHFLVFIVLYQPRFLGQGLLEALTIMSSV